MRILIVKLSSIGDIVHAMPAAAEKLIEYQLDQMISLWNYEYGIGTSE